MECNDLEFLPHPGETLQEEIEEYNLTMQEASDRTRLPVSVLEEICRGERPITELTAKRLCWLTNESDKPNVELEFFWLRLQKLYDEDYFRLKKEEEDAAHNN